MRFEILIPPAGDGVESCQLVKWHAKDSARVQRGELILTVETDKASCEIEAEFTGELTHQAKEGATLKIGESAGWIEHDGSEIDRAIRELRNNQRPVTETSSGKRVAAVAWKAIQYTLMILGLRYIVEFALGSS